MSIKPIETSYRGYRFRSRLEARWAVFFDALGLRWEYEPEGFELSDGVRYLPDFRVTSPQGMVRWYEIKPRGVTSDPKVSAFNDATRASQASVIDDEEERSEEWVQILAGDPVEWVEGIRRNRYGEWDGGCCPRCGDLTHWFAYSVNRWNGDTAYVGCGPCDFNTPSGGGHPAEPGVLASTAPHKGLLLLPAWSLKSVEAKVRSAAIKARSARFEHGECGAMA